MTGFLRRLVGGQAQKAGEASTPQLTLAAFGKHPGWDDHIPGIGLETEQLARVKQSLYVAGIGGQIDSGAWEKLEAGKRVEGFDHTFLWLRSRQVLLGQFWSSTDRKGRAKYPMVLCVESQGLTPRFLLTRIRPELERLRAACRSAGTAEQVTAECVAGQERMRALLRQPGGAELQATAPLELRRGFLEHPSLGPDRLGLLRIQHELASTFDTAFLQGNSARDLANFRARHLRVPRAGDSTAVQLGLWAEFFQCAVPPNVPVLLIGREGADWLEVINGEPGKDDFFCLQASPAAIPITTQIPYELPPQSAARLQDLEKKFLNAASAPVPPPLPGAAVAPPAGGGRKSWWLIVAAILIGAGIVGWQLFRADSGEPSVVAAAKPPAAPEPTVAGTPGSTDEADAKRRAEDQARAEIEARRRADEKSKVEAETLRLARENLAREKLAAEARAKQEAEKRLADEKAKAEADKRAEAKRTAEAEARRLAEEQRIAAEKAAAEASRIAAEKIQREKEFATALEAGRTAMNVTNYAEALARSELALKLRPSDPGAVALKSAAESAKDLAEAEAHFEKQDYQATLALCGKHSGVAAFDALAKKAQELHGQSHTEQLQQLVQRLDVQLEILRVKFDLLKASDAVSDEAKREKPFSGLSSPQVAHYLKVADQLEKAYPEAVLNQNDRRSKFEKLKKTIAYSGP